ncbi:TetR/AcrR family transcriptional regulator C-terminal domain-containing protein [Paraburkholderia sediminicola]|uniref:TetR/AcrR family transcriptional regulator C-terminal domain-containing protein n=1 Tax=Paraburkholderia sediminicola TaxID=458836 RepID=UPI0038B8F8FB
MKRKLTPEDVRDAAIEVLDEGGLDQLTMRAIASRLRVNHNAVNWHARSKANLLAQMADEFFCKCLAEPLPRHWKSKAKELSRRIRNALLAHKDGARVVAGAYSPLPNTLALAEAMIAALSKSGVAIEDAAQTHWVLLYFTLGITQEQQSMTERVISLPDDVTESQYPLLYASRPQHYQFEEGFDKRFEYGLNLILSALDGA